MATQKKESIRNNNWVVTIGGGVFLFFITDVLLKQNLLGIGLTWISQFFGNKYNLPLWLLVILVLSGAGITILTFWLWSRLTKKEPEKSTIPKWTKFNQLEYCGVLLK